MKLNKANSNGSISVMIPKKLAEAIGWKAGDEVKWQLEPDLKSLKLIKEEVSQ